MSQLVFGDIRSARALKAGATKRQVSVYHGGWTGEHRVPQWVREGDWEVSQ